MLALQDLQRRLDPAVLRGTVILVLVANPPAFFARTVYYGPSDWKNLNRSFPGDSAGTLSERIAAVLVREIIDQADIVVDCHAGDANEALLSYAVGVMVGDSARDARTGVLLRSLGFPRLLEPLLPSPPPVPTRYLSRTAAARGKLSFAIESGELGSRDERYVQPIAEGLMNLLRASGNLPGAPTAFPDGRLYAANQTIEAPATGMLWPRRKLGDLVREGDTVAVITSLTGEMLAAVRSPVAGLLIYQAITPPISSGETAAAVAVPVQ